MCSYLTLDIGPKLKSAPSSGHFGGSKSRGIGRWAPAATRFIAYAPNFPFPSPIIVVNSYPRIYHIFIIFSSDPKPHVTDDVLIIFDQFWPTNCQIYIRVRCMRVLADIVCWMISFSIKFPPTRNSTTTARCLHNAGDGTGVTGRCTLQLHHQTPHLPRLYSRRQSGPENLPTWQEHSSKRQRWIW